MLELDCGAELNVPPGTDFFSSLGPRPAVCLISPRDPSAQPYLIRTQDLRRRLERLLGPLDPASKRLNLRDFAKGIRYRLTGSKLEQILTYYENAKRLFPERYKKLMRLRPPAVLKVNLRNAYPRCFVTRRVPVDSSGSPINGTYYGRSLRANPPNFSPARCSISSRCAAAKSKSAATLLFPAASTPK